MTLIECVPNFSEGRRSDVIDQIVAAIGAVVDVEVLDCSRDAAHNRCVVTFVGSAEAAAEAAYRGVAAAARLIDLNQHQGAHPRFGAADVVPFVPLSVSDMPVCVETARAVGRRVAAELGIPVYFYADAALTDDRRDLARVRAGGFEGLRTAIAQDFSRRPDAGPARVHPTAGAVAVGARPPLIAFNVNLATQDLGIARSIAQQIRERDGGLPGLKALGLVIDGGVQVSMNLTDIRVTGLWAAFEAVRTRALALGVAVRNSEVVGLVPLEALVDVAKVGLSASGFGADQVLERRLLDSDAVIRSAQSGG